MSRKILIEPLKISFAEASDYLWCKENKIIVGKDNLDEIRKLKENGISILWDTIVEKIVINARDIIQDACDELHEDASDHCDIKSLQTLLDNWCEQQTGTSTYYQNYDKCITVDELLKHDGF